VVTTAGKKPREGTCVVRQRDALRRRLLGSYDAAALIADKGQPWLHRVVAARLRSIPAAVLGDDSSVGTCDTRLICISLIDFIDLGGRRQGSVEPVAPARHHWPCFCFHGSTSRCSARMPELRGKRDSAADSVCKFLASARGGTCPNSADRKRPGRLGRERTEDGHWSALGAQRTSASSPKHSPAPCRREHECDRASSKNTALPAGRRGIPGAPPRRTAPFGRQCGRAGCLRA
jgi:hypothetical protein